MKRPFLILIICLLFSSYQLKASHIHWCKVKTIISMLQEERDGSSFEKAIIIEETNSRDGIRAEYRWLQEHYPGYKMKQQALMMHEGKPYDLLTFKQKGKTSKIYFDISNFFGKY